MQRKLMRQGTEAGAFSHVATKTGILPATNQVNMGAHLFPQLTLLMSMQWAAP